MKEFSVDFLRENMMGPNALTLLHELLEDAALKPGMRVMDLGCGKGLTSMCLAELGVTVFAVDLWISAAENYLRFQKMAPGRDIVPIHADAADLPFADGYFDAVVSVDAYQYFGYDPAYMDEKLAHLVKKGGLIALCVPGLKRELPGDIPEEMKKSWTKEDISTFHTVEQWQSLLERSETIDITAVREMRNFEACWEDWLACENEYAVLDRAAMRAGAGKYMNFVSMICRRK